MGSYVIPMYHPMTGGKTEKQVNFARVITSSARHICKVQSTIWGSENCPPSAVFRAWYISAARSPPSQYSITIQSVSLPCVKQSLYKTMFSWRRSHSRLASFSALFLKLSRVMTTFFNTYYSRKHMHPYINSPAQCTWIELVKGKTVQSSFRHEHL